MLLEIMQNVYPGSWFSFMVLLYGRVRYMVGHSIFSEHSFLGFYRSSPPEVVRKGALKICSKYAGRHPCQSVVSIMLLK